MVASAKWTVAPVLVAAGEAARLLVDQLAEAVEEGAFGIDDAGRDDLVLQAECGEFAHGVGQHGNADAELLHFRRALVNAAGNAVTVKVKGEGQAGDAAADDGDVHGWSSVPSG